jgi:hypothetical protein
MKPSDPSSPPPEHFIERRRYPRYPAPQGLSLAVLSVPQVVDLDIRPATAMREGQDRLQGRAEGNGEQSIGGGIDTLIRTLRENRAKLIALGIQQMTVTAVRHEK